MECAGSPPSPFAGGLRTPRSYGTGGGRERPLRNKSSSANRPCGEAFARRMAAILASKSRDAGGRNGVSHVADARVPHVVGHQKRDGAGGTVRGDRG